MLTADDISKLLGQVALRDRQAFDMLYDHTSAKLFGVLLRLLKDRPEAEDALQEVFTKIWHKADRYSSSGASAMTWLITIARNHAIDKLRGRSVTPESLDEAETIATSERSPEEEAIVSSQRRKIDDCFDRLEENKSAAVKGAYLEGYSYQELAQQNDVPINTMRTWLRRSLAKLKECLEE